MFTSKFFPMQQRRNITPSCNEKLNDSSRQQEDIDRVTIRSKTTYTEDDLYMKQKYQSDEKWNKFVHKTDGLFWGFWHATDNKHYFNAEYHYKR